MNSPKMSVAMATLVLGLLAAPCATAYSVETRGSNCLDQCGGGNSIPYPFGIGPECSLPGFNLTCVPSANGTEGNLLLGNQSIDVWGLEIQPRAYYGSFPAITTSISYFTKLPSVQNYSIHWEAPGRPFAISGSSNMSLSVVGCGVKASLFVGDSGVELGNCYAACLGYETMRMLPDVQCVGMGCCTINITVTLRSFTLNMSRTSQAARGLEQVSVFITDRLAGYVFRASDLQYKTGGNFVATLSWAIPSQLNCKRAMEDKATYACVSSHSMCQEAAPIGGYFCNCSQGFYGNPYVVDGCVLLAPPPDYSGEFPALWRGYEGGMLRWTHCIGGQLAYQEKLLGK